MVEMRDLGLLGIGAVAGVIIGTYMLPKVAKQEEWPPPAVPIRTIPYPPIIKRQEEIEEEARRRLVAID